MKKFLMLLAVAALPAAAQWRHFGDPELRPTGYFGVGVSAPVNPIATHLNTGWNLAGGGGLRYGFFGFTIDGMYNDFGISRRALIEEGLRRGREKYWAVTANPAFHVNPKGPVDFYITGGAGVYGQITSFRVNDGRFGRDFRFSDQLVKPGVNGGAGFNFHLGRERDPKFFVEARYHHMFTRGSGASFVPVTIGVRF
jgi:hypothetical protein